MCVLAMDRPVPAPREGKKPVPTPRRFVSSRQNASEGVTVPSNSDNIVAETTMETVTIVESPVEKGSVSTEKDQFNNTFSRRVTNASKQIAGKISVLLSAVLWLVCYQLSNKF